LRKKKRLIREIKIHENDNNLAYARVVIDYSKQEEFE